LRAYLRLAVSAAAAAAAAGNVGMIQDRPTTRPQPAIGHYDAVSNLHDDDICETRFSMLCTAVWNTLPKTVLGSF